jgi:hypothetical protein
MAVSNSSNRDTWLGLAAGAVLVMLIALLVVNDGHSGQPSFRSGPGNPMASNQAR